MAANDDEDELLRTVALRNASSILRARQLAEQELILANAALERRTSELAHALAMVRATLESTTDGVVATDREGNVTGYNERFLQMWNVPADIARTRDWVAMRRHAANAVKDPDAFFARVAEIYASSAAEAFDVIEFVDGRVFERYSRLQLVDERNVGRVWSFRDITQRRRAEDALRDETRVLELLNTTGKAIASTLDLSMLVQVVSDAATQLVGARYGAFYYYAHADRAVPMAIAASGGAPGDAFVPDAPRFAEWFGSHRHAEQTLRTDDATCDPRFERGAPGDGMLPSTPVVRSLLAAPVITRTGEVIGGLVLGHPDRAMFSERSERIVVAVAAQAAVAIDNARLYEDLKRGSEERERLLDAERAARAEAEHASRMKDEFLATLSHELRTPLTAILGWSQILQRGNSAPDDVARGLETIARNARAQTQLIEDLLDMSRIISGKVRLDVQTFDIASVVEAAIDSVRLSADAREIALVKSIDPLAGDVSGDPNRLQQVFWNLLTNAVKFTPRGGRVDVTVGRVRSQIRISVRDTGMGIASDFLPHVFDRFRQADASTTRRYGGLGLGLSIVKQLVDLHGGSVRAESDGVGQGASFIVCLPLAAVRAERLRDYVVGLPSAALTDPYVDLTGLRVLVLDDEDDARDLIGSVLVQCGAHVSAVSTAADALRQLAETRHDVLISDIGMPGTDGYEFMRELRGLSAVCGGATPAIALTAFASSEDRTRVMIAGYQVHLAKPIEPQELAATVGSLAGRLAPAKS